MNKKTIEVNNIASFEFWFNMFKLRSKKWLKETLKRLKTSRSIFETEEDRQDKIKAIKFILKENN
jgi:hypothetical protein